MDTKLNINSIEAGSITYDKLNQDVVDKFNTKADSASVTNVSNRVTAIEELIATDSDAVIDKWDEVVTFLDGISATDDLEGILANKANTSTVNDLLDGKLDKTGGTINGIVTFGGNNYVQIKPYSATSNGGGWSNKGLVYINGDNEEIGGIYAFGNNKALDYIFIGTEAYNGVNLRVGKNKLRWGDNAILHEGNVGEYALKTDGSNAMTGDLQLLTMSSGTVDVAVTEGLFLYQGPSSGGVDVGLPGNYINVFNVGGTNTYSNLQLAWRRDAPNPALYARIGESSRYSDWKTIAFTDSDITGNAKGAYNLVCNYNDSIASVAYVSGSQFYVGDTIYRTIITNILGKEIRLRTGESASTAMTINSSGNATIGSSDLASLYSNCKFYVNGRTIISSALSNNAWVSDTAQIRVNATGTDYFAGFAVTSGGQAVIQGGHTNVGAIPILINPSGGAVNVGGNLAPNTNNSLSLGTSTYRWSNVYSTLGDFNGAVTIRSNADGAELLRFSTDRPWKFSQIGTGAAAALYLSPDATSKSFIIADSDTSRVFEFWVSESNSSATFNSKLTVAKLATFNGSALIPTGQSLTIGDAVLEYDGGLKSSHNFIGNLTGTATKISNVLKFGSKTFDGSSEQTITATDLGITSDTVSEWGFTKNAGTVTSIATGTGLTGGPITGTGTISLNSTYQTYCTNGNAAWASYTTVTSIASIPVGYKLVKCTISAAGSFALESTSITAGREIHIIIYNSSSSDVVVSLPTASPYINFSADSLTVPANKYAEINVISDGSNLYIRTLA